MMSMAMYELEYSLNQTKVQIACIREGIGFLEMNEALIQYRTDREELRVSEVGETKRFHDLIENGKFDYYFKYNHVFATPKHLFIDKECAKQIANLQGILGLPFSAVTIISAMIGAYRLLESNPKKIHHRKNHNKVYDEIIHFIDTINKNRILKLKLEFHNSKFDENSNTLTFEEISENPKLVVIYYP